MRRPILLVDDDDALRGALSAFLEAGGFIVLTAPDGERGLERDDSARRRLASGQ
jgi:DNA-binding response OmpR family regulator